MPDLVANWRYLTSQQNKFEVYSREAGFADAWSHACDQLGEHTIELLQRGAVALLRPDALRTGRVNVALDYIETLGLVTVLLLPVRISPWTVDYLWQYQWCAASADRVAMVRTMLTSWESVLAVFRSNDRARELPASVELSAVKGSGHPHERHGHELRSVLGSPNRVLTFVHVADEPIDIVREIGLLLDREQGDKALASLLAVRDQAPRSLRLPDVPAPDRIDADATLEGVIALVGEHEERLLRLLTSARQGASLSWTRLRAELRDADVDVPLWDQIVLAAAFGRNDDPPTEAVIPDSGRRGWIAGLGLMAGSAAANRACNVSR